MIYDNLSENRKLIIKGFNTFVFTGFGSFIDNQGGQSDTYWISDSGSA